MPNDTSAGYRFGYVAEVTPGTTPASPLQIVRTVGGGGKMTAQSTESEETHLSETSDVIRTAIEGGGTVPMEISYGGVLDEWLQAILGGTWTTNALQVGSTKRTFTFEDQWTVAGVYQPFKYSLIEALGLNFAVGSKPTGSMTYVSASPPTALATVSAGTGAATAAHTNPIMTPIGSIQLAQEGGSGSLLAGGPGVTAFSIEINRPTIKMPQLGSFALAGAEPDKMSVKGSLSLYFATKTLMDKYLADTTTSLALTVGGASALKYAFLMSKVKLVDGGVQPVGRGQAVIQQFQYQAIVDATNSSLKVTRTP